MTTPKHPIQPLVMVDGVLRFKANKIVRDLLDFATPLGFGLNEIIRRGCLDEDMCQLAQLIGYSHSGAPSYVSDEVWEAARVMHESSKDETSARLDAVREELDIAQTLLRELRDKLNDTNLGD